MKSRVYIFNNLSSTLFDPDAQPVNPADPDLDPLPQIIELDYHLTGNDHLSVISAGDLNGDLFDDVVVTGSITTIRVMLCWSRYYWAARTVWRSPRLFLPNHRLSSQWFPSATSTAMCGRLANHPWHALSMISAGCGSQRSRHWPRVTINWHTSPVKSGSARLMALTQSTWLSSLRIRFTLIPRTIVGCGGHDFAAAAPVRQRGRCE